MRQVDFRVQTRCQRRRRGWHVVVAVAVAVGVGVAVEMFVFTVHVVVLGWYFGK